MNSRVLVKNMIAAFTAQGTSFAVSVLTSLLVPKVMGVQEFGYWQLFILYSNYISYGEFGLIDGVYLLNGGKRRKESDKRGIGTQVKFGGFVQLLITLGLFCIALLGGFGEKRTFVIIALALLVVPNNVMLHLGYIFQSMNETRLFSTSQVLDRLTFLIPTVLLVVSRCASFELYVCAFLIGRIIACAYCVVHAWDFLCTHSLSISDGVRECIEVARIGLPHMVATAASMLIVGIARMAIDSAWGIEVFGKVSLSLSLVNFFTAFVNQAGLVLFPSLREAEKEKQTAIYLLLKKILEIILPAAYLLYFPITLLVGFWLPQYRDSLHYFAYLLPICVFDSKMSLCFTTYFRTLRREKTMLYVNLLAVAISCGFAVLGVFVLNSPDVVLLGAVVGIVVRSIRSEDQVDEALSIKGDKTALQEVAVSGVFCASILLLKSAISFFVYLIAYAIYLFMNRKKFAQVIQRCFEVMHQKH